VVFLASGAAIINNLRNLFWSIPFVVNIIDMSNTPVSSGVFFTALLLHPNWKAKDIPGLLPRMKYGSLYLMKIDEMWRGNVHEIPNTKTRPA